MKQVVTYQLENGSTPAYIAEGGYYPNADRVLVGVTVDQANLPAGLTIFETLGDLTVYLASYKDYWQAPSDPTWVDYQPDTPLQAAEFIWQKLTS